MRYRLRVGLIGLASLLVVFGPGLVGVAAASPTDDPTLAVTIDNTADASPTAVPRVGCDPSATAGPAEPGPSPGAPAWAWWVVGGLVAAAVGLAVWRLRPSGSAAKPGEPDP